MDTSVVSVDVMVGGAITGIVALLGVITERRWAAGLRNKESLSVQSALGFSVQVKLAASYGWAKSVDRAVDECFKDAANTEGANFPPGVKVTPLIGIKLPAVAFSPDELALLLSTGDQGLVERLLALQWTIETTASLLDTFNVSRGEFSRFVADNAISGELVDGLISRVSLPAQTRHALDVREGELNNLVSDLLEALPKNMSDVRELSARVESALKSVPGLTVRKVEFLP